MVIEDLSGLGKPMTKFLEVVAAGVGIYFEPIRIKRKALAEMEALKIKTEGISTVMQKNKEAGAIAIVCQNDKIDFEDVSKFGDRALASKNYRHLIEQKNIENVIAKSIEHVGDTVAEEDVDIDWRTRFFNKAKEISHEQMQEVWGKILALQHRP